MATANTPALSPDIADLIERSERAAPEPLEARERFVVPITHVVTDLQAEQVEVPSES